MAAVIGLAVRVGEVYGPGGPPRARSSWQALPIMIDGEMQVGGRSVRSEKVPLTGSRQRPKKSRGQELTYVLAEHVRGVGGPPESATLLCEALAALGFRVRLFTPYPATPPFAERLDAAGVKVTTSPLRWGSRWRLPQKCLVAALYAKALWRRPALVYGIGLTAQVGYLLRLPHLVPVVPWENTEALPRAKFVDEGISGHLHRAAGVIAPSQSIAANIRATYGYQGLIYLLPFWASRPAAECQCPSAERTENILYLGRYDLEKGFEYLFRAFERVLDLRPGATLTLHGSGAGEAVAELSGRNPAIRIRGPVHGRAFEDALRACDAVVLPSVSEGYPLCLLDACARGKPIVASRVGAIPDVFEGRACALLVPPRDVDQLAQALITVLTDAEDDYAGRCEDAVRLFEEVSAEGSVRLRLTEVHAAVQGLADRNATEGVAQA